MGAWTAEFVTSPSACGGPGDPALYVRREFEVGAGLQAATLHVTAVGLVEPHLNGVRIGDEVLMPGWTSYRHRLNVSSFDVTPLLLPGRNAVGAIVGQGWAVGRIGWENKRHRWSEQPAVLLELELVYADRTERVVTDEGFRVGTGGVRANGIYDGETFDATLEPAGWDQPGFADADWVPAVRFEWDRSTLAAPVAPAIKRIQEVAPVNLTRRPDGAMVVDFGQILTGWMRLTAAGAEPGTTITLRHAELLGPDDSLDVRTLRSAKATDRWVLAGPEPAVFEPRFTFHGFRYVEITGYPGDLDADDVRAIVLHSEMRRTGWFSSSNELLDRLHENAVWSMKGNVVGVPTDCPQRDERVGWTGDINAFAPTAVLLHDARAFLTNWLVDLRAEQAATGSVPWVVPDVTDTPSAPTALWGDVAVALPWVLYREYGDLSILADSYESMAAFTRQVEELLDEHGLWSAGFQWGDWLDPDAPPENAAGGKTDRHLVASAYFCRTARLMAQAAELLGRTEDAAHFGALADRVRAAFRREYVTKAGRITNESATAYALAICFGILDDEQLQHAGDRLADLVAKAGYTISTGFAGTPHVTDALTRTGHLDAAYLLLLQTRCPSFLYPVTMGATTIWERWDAITPDGRLNDHGMTSLNHYALGAVVAWLYEVIAGLSATEPGWRRFRVAPRPGGGLTHARAEHDTVLGRVAAGWRIDGRALTLEVTVPEGAEATVTLPLDPHGRTLLVGPGEHRWSYELPDDYGVRADFDMDTPLSELAADTATWAALSRVFAAHLPGIPIDGNDPQAAAISLNLLLQFVPGATDRFRSDLEQTLRDPGYADSVEQVAPPAAEDEGLAARAGLLTGNDFWSTREAEGLRPIVLADGPHGVRRQDGTQDNLGFAHAHPATCFPPAVATACSFDPDLLTEIGEALGREARALGVDVLLGPAVNLKRSPLCGRNFEYFAEDPLLTGVLGAAFVRGVQRTGVGTCVKHFAANNQETDRMRVDVQVDERTLRELYLPAFERIVTEARPTSVMSSYNAINGAFSSENPWLLSDVLRKEWGFDGVVVSDWGAIKDRVEALKAGVDLEMPGTGDEGTNAILAAVRERRLDPALIDRAVERLKVLADRTAGEPLPGFDAEAHHALARRAAAESIVLLRNENAVLPLRSGSGVVVIGELAVRPQFQGGGSSHVNPSRVDTPLDELAAALDRAELPYAAGYGSGGADGLLAEAVELARGAGVAIVFAGLDERKQSEGFDRETLDLPADQVALIEAVAAVAPTVVVLSNGGVVTLEPWHDKVAGIVEAWAPGQAGGGAIADILTGRVNPSGRLAETIPLALEDTPSFLNFPGEHEVVRYGEGVFVGYRHYTSTKRAVRYPFGHGLSYTTFAHDDFAVEVTGPDRAVARVTVRNTGDRTGADVVQLYVAPAPGPVRRPVRELAAFAKVTLAPGEARTVELALDRRAFAYWDQPRRTWWVQPGRYTVQLGRSASDIAASASLELAGDTEKPKPLSLDSTVKAWFEHPVVGPALQEAMLANATEEQKAAAAESADLLRMVETMPMGQFARFPGVDIPQEALAQLIALSHADA